jgi:hypothetical protein
MEKSWKIRLVFAVCIFWAELLSGEFNDLFGNESQPMPLPRLLVSREAEFGIPFTMKSGDGASESASSVRLFYSSDGGVSWNIAQQVRSEESKFVFQAEEDGEYWFALDTLEGGSESMSFDTASPLVPGLRVLVDTTSPHLEFEVGRTSSEQLWAAWSIQESRLRPHSFHILYRGEEEDFWTSVPVTASDPNNHEPFEGWAAWELDVPYDEIVVRAEAIDLAGNSTVFTEHYDLTAAGLAVTAIPQGRERTPVAPTPELLDLEISPVSSTTSDGWQPASSLRETPVPRSETENDAHENLSNFSGWRPAERSLSTDVDPMPFEQPEVAAEPEATLEPETEPVMEGVEEPPLVESIPLEPASMARTHTGAQQAASPSFIRASVHQTSEENDVYGLSDPDPIRIRSANLNSVEGKSSLQVRWTSGGFPSREARISLSCADSLTGPWRTLAESLDNSGRFEGPLESEQSGVSGPIFIRLEALHEDGSIISTMSPTPIVVE